jgi:hypothetical protein
MTMREECTHYQSRTYPGDEVVRFCDIDLAPEAPWRCPEDCQGFEVRLMDAGWVRGTLVDPPVEPEPPGEHVADLLDEAEDIVNEVYAETLIEVEQEQAPTKRHRWWRRR